MSTRRDRAARVILEEAWADGESDVTAEAYRIADLVLAEADRIPDVSEFEELMDRSSLGTPGAKAAIASVSDEQAQKAIDIANRIRAVGYDGFARFSAFHEMQVDEAAYWASLDQTDDGAASALTDDPPSASSSPITDGEAATPPAAPVSAPVGAGGETAAESATAAANSGAAPSSVLPRPFLLVRKRDVTGLSGIGVVARGCEWPGGTVSLRWATAHPSTVHWDNIDDLLAVHGHDGATVIRWLEVRY